MIESRHVRLDEILTNVAGRRLVGPSAGDITSGSETELQAAVHGDRYSVDLALAIENSNEFLFCGICIIGDNVIKLKIKIG